MSGKAFGWAREAVCSGGLAAKAVLLLMADYATGAEHELWPSVATMAQELQAAERTVQRALNSLVEDRLIEREFRTSASGKSTSSRYRLTVERASASVAEGCQSDTPRGDFVTPSGVTECRGEGVTVTPSTTFDPRTLSKEDADASLARARAVEETFSKVWPVWASTVRGRSSRIEDWPAWVEACRTAEPADVERGALAYLADDDARRGRGMAMVRFLKGARWEPYLLASASAGATTADAPVFAGPADFAEAVIAGEGRDWFGSWVAPSGWDDEGRVLLARTGIAAERIGKAIPALLARFNIKVSVRKVSG